MNFRKMAMVGVFTLAMIMSAVRPSQAQFCDAQGQGANSENPAVDTALGCIPVRLDSAIAWFLPFLFGIAGGISFLLMVYGFIQMTLSSGDPKAVQGAQETVTSAIVGLMISIFSLFIIKFIAVGILKIPGIS